MTQKTNVQHIYTKEKKKVANYAQRKEKEIRREENF